MSPIPSQDKLLDYADAMEREPVNKEPEQEIEQIESPYKTNVLTTSNVRKQTRKNIQELERITGTNFMVSV